MRYSEKDKKNNIFKCNNLKTTKLKHQTQFDNRTYFYSQNFENRKNDKIIILYFPKFVSFYHFSVPEELRISEIFFAILLTKNLIDSRKGIFSLYQKQKKTNNEQPRQVFLSRKKHFLNCLQITFWNWKINCYQILI